MTATQTQIRRDTAANLAASTPALAELGYDTTNKRLVQGDGSTPGGIPTPNYLDNINNVFSYATAGGSANAITLSLAISPGGYATPLIVRFKATATNTGATTINVNGLGLKNIYKFTAGALGALAAGDIVNGGIYEAAYDGTQFQLLTYQNAGLLTVKQGDLATATGTFSGSVNATGGTSGSDFSVGARITLPGGQYGFDIEVANSVTETVTSAVSAIGFFKASNGSLTANNYRADVVPFMMEFTTTRTVVGRQLYITSSPPFDLGDGAALGFFYVVVNSAGDIIGHYAADVPPWAYNGPTKIRADRICPKTGKKYCKVMVERSFEEIMQGAQISYEEVEITMQRKNADMALIPHPFDPDLPAGCHVVMLDPMDDRIGRLIEYQNAGGSDEVLEQLSRGFIQVDNDKISKRKGPPGINIHRMKYKYSGGKN